jgi:pyruvate,water dikinase
VSILLSIEEATDRSLVGGKALALGLLRSKGFRVPPALCVTTLAYRRFVDASGLPASIARELGRKRFEDMRWEEIWDASLRIRGLFDRAGWPADLESDLREGLERAFGERPVAVRSSAPGEDGGKASFAGLHESFLNVRGPSAVLGRVRQVFASLWSDRALLYRKELGLDPEGSEMAVLVQEMVSAQRSGVVFGVSPSDPDRAVVEAVWGLNEGLVDGTVEPDRWILRRDTGDVLSFRASAREKWVVPGPLGTEVADLPADRAGSPPISREEIPQVYRAAMEAEALFGSPQDGERSFGDGGLSVLPSRPITARRGAGGDERAWDLTLRRSHANLKVLKDRVERELLPEMAREADAFASIGLSRLSDDGLEEEIRRRGESVRKWEEIYRGEFIPLAHGVRLFGEFYNDHLAPGDPFEFVRLLPGTGMLSVERNSGFGRLAERLRTESSLAEAVRREGRATGFRATARTPPGKLRRRLRLFGKGCRTPGGAEPPAGDGPCPGRPANGGFPGRRRPAERVPLPFRRGKPEVRGGAARPGPRLLPASRRRQHLSRPVTVRPRAGAGGTRRPVVGAAGGEARNSRGVGIRRSAERTGR